MSDVSTVRSAGARVASIPKVLRRTLKRRVRTRIAHRFHRMWYASMVWNGGVTWEGVPILKNPLDLWLYQEILLETRPDLIIETGTYRGGSALYLARILDIIGSGRIISVDTNEIADRPVHPRITYVTGSSTDPEVVADLASAARAVERVMVILDSDHSAEHVSEELRHLASFVTAGCYLVVEDTNINGHPARPGFGPGPMEAVTDFIGGEGRAFFQEKSMERFYMTFNPMGWLRRS